MSRAIGVESAVFFDELIRTGRDKQLTNPGPRQWIPLEPFDSRRGVSAVAARAHHDDDEAGRSDRRCGCLPGSGELGRRRRRTRSAADAARWRAAHRGRQQRQRPVDADAAAERGRKRHAPQRDPAPFHDGEPGVLSGDQQCPTDSRKRERRLTSRSIARPFGEAELLAVAKAYQDASGFHLKHPALTV